MVLRRQRMGFDRLADCAVAGLATAERDKRATAELGGGGNEDV